MRPPHPVLHELYRQAAVPSQVMARLHGIDEVLARFDPQLIAGGEGGDELLVRLIRGLQLGELLGDTLARLESPSSPSAEGTLRFERPLPEEHPRRTEIGRPRDAETVSKSVVREASVREAVAVPRRPLPREEVAAPLPAPSLPRTTSVLHGTPAPSLVPPASLPAGQAASRRIGRETRPSQPPRRRRYSEGTHENPTIPPPTIPPTTQYDAKAAHEILLAHGESAGVIEALHQPVGRDVPERIVFELRNYMPARKRPQSEPREEQPWQRLAATVARVERATRSNESPPVERVRRDGVTALPPLDMRGAQRLASPVGGLRGLVALAQWQPAPATRPAPAPAHLVSLLPAFDEADLAARICELLRRDAERNGIDVTGVEP